MRGRARIRTQGGSAMSAEQPEAPAAELAKLRRACKLLGKSVVGNRRAMEAARIEDFQNGANAGMQWILNSIPDGWDDPETAWDGTESANEWWDRTDGWYRAAETDAEPARAESRAPVPAAPATAIVETLEALPAAGRVEQDTATAKTLITGALLSELGRRLYEYENAIDWNTSCTSCAAVPDSSVRERVRAEAAEAKVAAASRIAIKRLRQIAAIEALCRKPSHVEIHTEGGNIIGADLVKAADVLAIIGTGTQDRSDEKGPDHD